MLTRERLIELLSYDLLTGLFIRNKSRGGSFKKGTIAGSLTTGRNAGYIAIQIDGKSYKAHRLAFLYMTGYMPKNQVDHKNHIRTDNRWDNLREVTRGENAKNQSIPKSNTSGIAGVYWNKNSKRWCAQIESLEEGKRKNRGRSFKKIEDAIAWRQGMERLLGFYKNHGNSKDIL